jgi:hypothetical protein
MQHFWPFAPNPQDEKGLARFESMLAGGNETRRLKQEWRMI